MMRHLFSRQFKLVEICTLFLWVWFATEYSLWYGINLSKSRICVREERLVYYYWMDWVSGVEYKDSLYKARQQPMVWFVSSCRIELNRTLFNRFVPRSLGHQYIGGLEVYWFDTLVVWGRTNRSNDQFQFNSPHIEVRKKMETLVWVPDQ